MAYNLLICLVFVLFVSNVYCHKVVPTHDEHALGEFDIIDRIKSQGYEAECHHMETQDGYILEIHRIKPKTETIPENGEPKAPIFMMHGLTGASDSWLATIQPYGIALELSDNGYDVWLGNARGNVHSRKHRTLNPENPTDRPQFFNYSWHEVGYYDLPAMIDYTLNKTERPKLHYVGHSHGGTVFFVLNSMRPEYNDKFSSAHLFAPIGYVKHFPNSVIKQLTQYVDIAYPTLMSLGVVELYPPEESLKKTNSSLNVYNTKLKTILKEYNEIIKKDPTFYDAIKSGFNEIDNMGGASTKQFAHYGQNINSKAFRAWDYGKEQNMKVYNGSAEPPAYDLKIVSVKTTLHYSTGDNVVAEQDIVDMSHDMPNAIVRKVPNDTFKHEDYITSKDVKHLITVFLLEELKDTKPIHDNPSHKTNRGTLLLHYFNVESVVIILLTMGLNI